MEDQQSSSGNLTDPSDDEQSTATASEPGAGGGESNEETSEFADINDDDTAVDHPEGDDVGTTAEAAASPAKRRTGRLLAVAVGLAAALFVGSAAFAGAAVQPYLVDRALVATKMQLVRTAANAIATLWNYTPENMDTLVDRASIYLSGDLEADYRKFIDAIAPANKHAKVTDTTEITGAAVESLEGSEATVLVYTNTSATSELTKNIPSLMYLSYRVFMKRNENRWVIYKMPTITSLNLTPQF